MFLIAQKLRWARGASWLRIAARPGQIRPRCGDGGTGPVSRAVGKPRHCAGPYPFGPWRGKPADTFGAVEGIGSLRSDGGRAQAWPSVLGGHPGTFGGSSLLADEQSRSVRAWGAARRGGWGGCAMFRLGGGTGRGGWRCAALWRAPLTGSYRRDFDCGLRQL